ncbi:hypothetical protein GCM10017600_22030 [Streptosporangium carneum]|uniref:Uncharacterized protein n=1 Tax=Streptosporangium carneum TaxID=47481 RepID=A0A9W6I077_9ACTN|nr:hypothetical protein GCM10017600_22030 [Streptosporangium carneum]
MAAAIPGAVLAGDRAASAAARIPGPAGVDTAAAEADLGARAATAEADRADTAAAEAGRAAQAATAEAGRADTAAAEDAPAHNTPHP